MQQITPASLFRRFAAMVYDTFIIFSFLLLITALALAANRGESLSSYQIPFLIYLITVTGAFLAWFWHKGQTIGMLAWKIYVVDENGQRISWAHAYKRYFLAILSWGLGGLGILWCLWDKENRMLHDKLAKTKVVALSLG